MGLAWMEYARERRTRLQWPVIATVLATLILAFVGNLCWTRFGDPLRQRIALSSHLKTSAEALWRGVTFPLTQPVVIGGKTEQDRAGELLLDMLTGGVPQGSTLYFGRTADAQRYFLVSLVRTDTIPVRSLTLVVHVFNAGTILRSPAQIGDAQTFRLITFNKTFTIDPLTPAGPDRDLLLLSGNSDGAPFRFELSIDRDSKVQLVESNVAALP